MSSFNDLSVLDLTRSYGPEWSLGEKEFTKGRCRHTSGHADLGLLFHLEVITLTLEGLPNGFVRLFLFLIFCFQESILIKSELLHGDARIFYPIVFSFVRLVISSLHEPLFVKPRDHCS